MDISVIVPTFNSKGRISACLKSILKQDFTGFEVIVVNDGSKDSTKEVAEKFNVRVFSKINQGPAIARNFGAQKAKGKILVFIDDDCVAGKDWLNEMVKPFNDQKVAGVQGAYKTNQKELCARFEQIEIEDRYERMKKSKNIDWIGSYSAAYRRDVFFELQGYDSAFPTASGEDPELSYKIAKAGHKLVFNPKAIVYHNHTSNFADYFKKKFSRAYWRILLYKKHPDKIISDSYTPQTIKIDIIIAGLMVISLILTLWSFVSPRFIDRTLVLKSDIMLIVFLLILQTPFVLKNMAKDPIVVLLSFAIFPIRAFAFGFGLFAGFINGVWKR